MDHLYFLDEHLWRLWTIHQIVNHLELTIKRLAPWHFTIRRNGGVKLFKRVNIAPQEGFYDFILQLIPSWPYNLNVVWLIHEKS